MAQFNRATYDSGMVFTTLIPPRGGVSVSLKL
jgi:hypothetical protein